ncbi:gluconeogenesis factor YvcK family protein [Anaerosoma tenue]|uniref:gluconeogenesis factor YvcK family protein n=1 Tax=Anaerosoma tenue TaxID=2933588 RepID=UPI002260C144|nr:gluconeogenesis factor YvcK family protein [Anaerosoma tenue]MCK8113919.1 YvcK family protein [Anaerosoma tenue]
MTTGGSAVAIGGGTGLPLVLRCMLRAGLEPTAVVTMADDGGSSGHLRRELGMLPPGDIRNCLVALADPGSELAPVFQYRFASGEGLAGHAIGNLIIAALADLEGGFGEAVEAAGRMLGVRGSVVPSTLADVVLSGWDSAGRRVIGQARVAETEGPISQVRLEPRDAPAYGPALDAIRDADVVVIGPGSLFTSIIPNFLVSGVTDALRESDARVVYVCNVANMRGETQGMDAADHVDALVAHGLEGLIDVALVDIPAEPAGRRHVLAGDDQLSRIRAHGVRVVTADLTDAGDPARHDQDRLLAALTEVW